MADQGASSLGNFVTNIIVARALARESFGTFGLILEAIFFLNAIQSALVTYPLSVHGATSDSPKLSRYATASLLLTMLLAAPVVLIALVAGALSGHLLVAACASLALVAWQLQETLRRALHAHLRHGDAILGDVISYLGQAVAVLLLVTTHRLTLERTFAVIALSSAAAAMVQLVQVGLARVSTHEFLAHARQFLAYGRFLAANNLTVIFSTLGYSWILTWFYGRAAVAEMYAVLVVLKLTNPMISGIVSVIVPAAAKANDSHGPRAAQRVAAKYAWLGAAVLIPYFAVLILFPRTVIALFYGQESQYAGDTNLLRLYVGCAALTYAVATASAYFNAVHQSRLSMIAQVANAGVSLVLGLPLALLGGLPAAAAGSMLAVAAQLGILLHFLARSHRQAGAIDEASAPIELPQDLPSAEPLRAAA